MTAHDHQAGDWIPHDSTKPPPALGPDFEVEAIILHGRLPIDLGSTYSNEIRTAPVHELPWDRVTAWRLP